MEYIGKKLLRYGDLEFIGDEYKIPINEELWKQLLSVASEKELNGILNEQLRFENYEAAAEVKAVIADRFEGK